MKRDVPDAALTVLGHTDAIRVRQLQSRSFPAARKRCHAGAGRPPALTRPGSAEVAIGKRQPIAPNDTADGRARNRRVEFLVSPSLGANLAAVQQRVVPLAYLSTGSVAAAHG